MTLKDIMNELIIIEHLFEDGKTDEGMRKLNDLIESIDLARGIHGSRARIGATLSMYGA